MPPRAHDHNNRRDRLPNQSEREARRNRRGDERMERILLALQFARRFLESRRTPEENRENPITIHHVYRFLISAANHFRQLNRRACTRRRIRGQ